MKIIFFKYVLYGHEIEVTLMENDTSLNNKEIGTRWMRVLI